jgi:hypothetical protein
MRDRWDKWIARGLLVLFTLNCVAALAASQTVKWTLNNGQSVTVTLDGASIPATQPATQPTTIPSQPQTPPPTPTIAGPGPWLGMNLEANNPWQTSAPWCDVTHQMTGWYAVDNTTVTYDPNGYPAGGHAKCHLWLYSYPPGTYHVHWDGPGPFFVTAKTIVNVAVEGAGHGGDVTFNSGDYIELYAQGPVTNVHLFTPDSGWQLVNGVPTAPRLYRDVFLAQVHPWHFIRLMPWCYEFMAELAREANLAAVWVNCPYGADDGYITAMAQAFVGCPAEIDFEYQNELWNTGNGYQGNLIRADAQAAPPGTYGSGDINQLGARRAAALTAHAGAIVRQVLGANHVKIIFGAQATWNAWAADGLGFLKPGDIDVLAVAPYFQPTGLDPVDTVANIEASCLKWIDTVTAPNLALNSQVAQKYGCDFWAYEGGQHLITGNPAVPQGVMLQFNATQIAAFNADLYTLTQADPGMGTLLDHLFAVAKKNGITRFQYFLLIGDWGKSGYWGVYRNVGDPDNAKALACKRAA